MKLLLPAADWLLVPVLIPCAYLLKFVRTVGLDRLPLCRRALLFVGVFPIRNHYYEPQFDSRHVDASSRNADNLPGIDWNVKGQLDALSLLKFTDELPDLIEVREGLPTFKINNTMFEAGDADYWYQTIRQRKPKRIIEIGSGNSTIVALRAIQKNREEIPAYICDLICVEPYEAPWLETIGATIIRKKIEDLSLDFFRQLERDDFLLIDSSHIIKPGGDVVYEYLQILPSLKPGVIVHMHDIFSPRHYRADWMREKILFWNEQYLLEAFLSHNKDWSILGALNFLHHNHFDALKSVCPLLRKFDEPGSFYIQKLR